MAQFVKRGNTFDVHDNDAMQVSTRLPARTYVVKNAQFRGFFLEEVDNFSSTGKIYGNTEKYAARIISTFEDRPASTGVLLVGEKGSGKTLLGKQISALALSKGYPVLLVNNAFCGSEFNTFIQSIEQPMVILFDEFEKVYDRDEQEQILTLLDGVFSTKTLFVLTVNDQWKVDQHLKNRPGRLYYRLDFKGLECDFIREYCEDNLHNKSHIEDICRLSKLYTAFNFDMLKAVVEEMNRYNESPKEVLALLNARPDQDDGVIYQVELTVDGKKVSNTDRLETSNITWEGNVLSSQEEFVFHYRKVKETNVAIAADESEYDDWQWERSIFTVNDIKGLDVNTGNVIMRNSAGDQAILARKIDKKFDYLGVF